LIVTEARVGDSLEPISQIALGKGATSLAAEKLIPLPILKRFVSGHDFSRAAKPAKLA